jgi:hypothetical protein
MCAQGLNKMIGLCWKYNSNVEVRTWAFSPWNHLLLIGNLALETRPTYFFFSCSRENVKLDATRRVELPTVDENYQKQSVYNELMENNSTQTDVTRPRTRQFMEQTESISDVTGG